MKRINNFLAINSLTKDTGEIYIEGNIADKEWWDDAVTPKEIKNSLDELGKIKTLNIFVNSDGGSCIAGNAIVDIFDTFRKSNKCTLHAHIRGIAASMATSITSICDKVTMADNALFMIHKPSAISEGNADDLRRDIELLDKVEETLVKNYMRRFKGTEEELRELMANVTWLTADEAVEYGFVDEISQGVKIVACANGLKIDNCIFDNAFIDLINNKYPKKQIQTKEEEKLVFDERLKEYGIDEEKFQTYNTESSKILEVIDLAIENFKKKLEKPFIEKQEVCNALECEDITAEQLIDYAKIGINPPKENPEILNKANEYDKILEKEREKALSNAIRAEGDFYNEKLTKKFLATCNYDEIQEQNEAWIKKAKQDLKAGTQIFEPQKNVENNVNQEYINPKDYMIGY